MRGNDVSAMSQDLSPASNAIRDYFVKQNCQESFVSIAFESEETFSTRLQQSIDRARKVTDEIIVYIPGGKSHKETIEETLENLAIKGLSATGFFGSYILMLPGPIHQKAVAELARLLIGLDKELSLDHEGPLMITRKLHMPEDSVNRWYQVVRQELRLQDTPPPDELLSDEEDKNKQPDGDMWPCYLELIRKIQGCPFFPTYINETAVSQTTESLLDVGMQWMGATGLLVDTVILQDIRKGHEGSDLESVTIHHFDCSASNLRRLVKEHRRTDKHRVLSWACRVKCQRGIECMGALQRVVDMMSDYDEELDGQTLNNRESIDQRYTMRLRTLAEDLSRAFATLPGAHLLSPWPVTEAIGKPRQLLEECHGLFSMFKESGIVEYLPFLIGTTEDHYRELLGGADLLPISNDFDEEEGIRRVAEILFSERNEIRISARYIPYQRPQIHVEQIRPDGVDEPILVIPGTSIHGFITDSGTSSQLGREKLTVLFEKLSKVADSQMDAEWQPVTLQVSRENVRDDFFWDFVTDVRGTTGYGIETDLNSLFAGRPIWATIPLQYLSTEFIELACFRQGLDLPENPSRSVMVKQLAWELTTPDEGRIVSFTLNKINLRWIRPEYRPKYEKVLLNEHGARTIAALREQDSIAIDTHFYEIDDGALPLLHRQLSGTSPSENCTRQNLIRSILDIPSRGPMGGQRHMSQRQLGIARTRRIPVPRVISRRVNESNLTDQQKRCLLIKLGKSSFRTVIGNISRSQQLLQGLELALARTPKLLSRVEDPEELLEYLSRF
uniref:ARAD1C21164p n=1 Tax=Blastobotrys adeninivorans TaxID=409370 RepID=A0A060T1K5_BLAAD